MSCRFILPANLTQLATLAETFLMAVGQATEAGLLKSTFQHNATLKNRSIPHLVYNIVEEIEAQAELNGRPYVPDPTFKL